MHVGLVADDLEGNRDALLANSASLAALGERLTSVAEQLRSEDLQERPRRHPCGARRVRSDPADLDRAAIGRGVGARQVAAGRRSTQGALAERTPPQAGARREVLPYPVDATPGGVDDDTGRAPDRRGTGRARGGSEDQLADVRHAGVDVPTHVIGVVALQIGRARGWRGPGCGPGTRAHALDLGLDRSVISRWSHRARGSRPMRSTARPARARRVPGRAGRGGVNGRSSTGRRTAALRRGTSSAVPPRWTVAARAGPRPPPGHRSVERPVDLEDPGPEWIAGTLRVRLAAGRRRWRRPPGSYRRSPRATGRSSSESTGRR